MTENDEKYTYFFGIFFENEHGLSDYEVLNLLNQMDKQIKLQEDFLDKIIKHLGYDDKIDLIKDMENSYELNS